MKRSLKFMLLAIAILAIAPLTTAQTSTTTGGFTMRFVGVEYDWTADTSTWTYGLTWNDGYNSPNSPSGNNPRLSHLTIDLCDQGVEVIDYSPKPPAPYSISFSEGNSDPGDWGFVIKWDVVNDGDIVMGEEYFFSFTLGDTYAVAPITFFAKAGGDHNPGTINGPSSTCDIAEPAIDVTKSCVPEAWVGDSIAYTIVVTNSGNVTLDNVQVNDAIASMNETIASLAPGESKTFNVSINATETGTIENVVTAEGSYYGNEVDDTASCTTNVFAPVVGKTAETSYERSWAWTIAKSVEEETLEFCGAGSVDLHYTIDVTRDNTDSDHTVEGVISIFNPTSTLTASISSVTDMFAGYGATVMCASSVVLPGTTTTCHYEITLPSAIDGTNVATVTMANGTAYSPTAAVTFGAPTSEIDATATVVDTVTCPEGFTCTGAGPFNFTDDASVNFAITVTKTTAECSSYFNVANVAVLSAGSGQTRWSEPAITELFTCDCGTGCSLTIGYWKTHAGFTGRNEDDVTQYLPIWLGTPYGAASIEVVDAAQAVSILKFELGHASNGITKLYAQMLAAKLNVANGASSDDINSILTKADNFLAVYNWEDWTSLKKNQKSDVITWMSLFDGYNNGDIGPGHCD